MPENAILAQARWLRRHGFSVIPVPRPGREHDGKVPILSWKRYQTTRPTDDELREWFGGEPMNIAIVTGAISNLIVIDCDSADGLRTAVRQLPYTPWQVKTSKGFHLYLRHPGVPVGNRARIATPAGKVAIDVRGDGGYVIGPGSVHASGVTYTLAGDWQRTDVPRFWPGWLARPRVETTTPDRPRHVPRGDVADRARRYLAAIPQPEIGHGSDLDTLYAACRLVRGFNISEADAVALLWDWAGGRPGWTRTWIADKVRNAQRFGTEPVGGLLA